MFKYFKYFIFRFFIEQNNRILKILMEIASRDNRVLTRSHIREMGLEPKQDRRFIICLTEVYNLTVTLEDETCCGWSWSCWADYDKFWFITVTGNSWPFSFVHFSWKRHGTLLKNGERKSMQPKCNEVDNVPKTSLIFSVKSFQKFFIMKSMQHENLFSASTIRVINIALLLHFISKTFM